MSYIVYLLLSIIVNEALVELLKSGFFERFRNFLSSKQSRVSQFFLKVVTCGYCSSVWTSAFVTTVSFLLIYPTLTGCIFFDIFVSFVLTHRLSNFVHDLWDRYISKYYIERD